MLTKYDKPPETLSRAEQFLFEVSKMFTLMYKMRIRISVVIYNPKHPKQINVFYVLFGIQKQSH